MNLSTRSNTTVAVLVLSGVAFLTAVALIIGLTMINANADERVQYPPGQTPCDEIMVATGNVSTQVLDTGGGGLEDPQGAIRGALRDARAVLNDRAGASDSYDATEYNRLADELSAAAETLITAYDGENENTPYDENADERSMAGAAYTTAETALIDWCFNPVAAETRTP